MTIKIIGAKTGITADIPPTTNSQKSIDFNKRKDVIRKKRVIPAIKI